MIRKLWWSAALTLGTVLVADEPAEQVKLSLSWGHQSPMTRPWQMRLVTNNVAISSLQPTGFEPGDRADGQTISSQAGGGDVDGVECILHFAAKPIEVITNLHRIWADLIARSDVDSVQRLQEDPAYRPDSRSLTVQLNDQGSQGFTVTVDQLLHQKGFWIPSLDIYLAVGEPPLSFSEHQQQLNPFHGKRILDQVARDPEATYQDFTQRWEDMGNPGYRNPAQTGPGHIVGITWDSALYKFGIDRGGGVWNDYGSPDRFHCWLEVGDLTPDLSAAWKGQRLSAGLPVISTELEKLGVHYQIEQFAYPLHGPPSARRGDIPMVLVQKVRVSNLTAKAASVPVKLFYRRLLPESVEVNVRTDMKVSTVEESSSGNILLAIESDGAQVQSRAMPEPKRVKPERPNFAWRQTELEVLLELPPNGSKEFILKVPSPSVAGQDRETLLAVNYSVARRETIKFWSEYLDKGAQFQVPEAAVNELVRASLWHALRLPRRHGGPGDDVKMDLPYSNFAYDQKGTPWPVNQAVYVDYMIYDLRGYHDIAAEELQAIYRNNQENNGHVGGYANWVVYTPGMIYSVAKNYLLSGDRDRLEKLLPQTLRGLDWCLSEIQKGAGGATASSGLVRGPLNDLTGDGLWAFNQAYIYAGLDLLGKALTQIGHPRAEECRKAAGTFQRSVEERFGAATTRSPLVQLRDHTWSPYVPCEVLSPHRLLAQWYPTDVDTGATHLPRLQALAPDGPLPDALLNDHEDNLYLHGWGMANEPVYNQQATVYLLRDNPKAAIRAFYSMMACAFSHSVFEPVEHRWTWGQYFGPPSTDGAWFELFRQMLIREREDDVLLLLQATPRAWLEDGKRIKIDRAPTYYGQLALTLESKAASGQLQAEINLPQRRRPQGIWLRLRHPQSRLIQSVRVNGQDWTGFDREKEWVQIAHPDQEHYTVVAQY